jgi:hypothetical protein
MGAKPSTKTPCIYPYTSYPLTDSSCSHTYADATGSAYHAMQIIQLTFCWIFFIIQLMTVPRIWKKFSKGLSWEKKQIPNPLLWLFTSLCITLAFSLEAIDLYSWSDRMDIAIYTILNVTGPCLTLCLAFDIVSFWKRSVSMLHSQFQTGFSIRFKCIVWFIVFLCSIGAETAGMLSPSHYKIFNGVALIILALLVTYLLLVALIYIRDILNILSNSAVDNAHTTQMLRMMRNKFISFTIPALATIIVWFWNGIMFLIDPSPAWEFVFMANISSSMVFGRIVAVLVCAGLTFMFANPFDACPRRKIPRQVENKSSPLAPHNNNSKKNDGMIVGINQNLGMTGGATAPQTGS